MVCNVLPGGGGGAFGVLNIVGVEGSGGIFSVDGGAFPVVSGAGVDSLISGYCIFKLFAVSASTYEKTKFLIDFSLQFFSYFG
jgi:hypothetical protein